MIIEIDDKDIELLLNKLNVNIEKCKGDINNPMLWDVEKNEVREIQNTSEYIVNKLTSKVDVKYIDVPNICFSLIGNNDHGEIEYSKQRIERGFDNSELWSLRDTIGNFIIPRLKAFRGDGSKGCYPARFESREVWDKKLDKIILSFELLVRKSGMFDLSDKEYKKYKKGMKLYHKYFLHLWC